MRVNGEAKSPICLLAVLLVCCASCGRLDRGRQVQTQGRLQIVRSEIVQFLDERGRMPSYQELELLCDNSVLKDAWGYDLRYEVHELDGVSHYVLASAGKNGELEVDALASYIGVAPANVDYEPNSDIVIVDGRFVRNAGK